MFLRHTLPIYYVRESVLPFLLGSFLTSYLIRCIERDRIKNKDWMKEDGG